MNKNPAAAVVDKIAAAAAANSPRENEYIGENGLLYCAVCNEPHQVQMPAIEGIAPARVVRCVCSCARIEEQRYQEQYRRDGIERQRRNCFQGTGMSGWNFKNDNGQRADLSDAAKKYAEQFKEHQRDGMGLLYYGPIGTGKTYLAACIANAVIDQGYTARMTNFAEISNELQSTWEKQDYIEDLCGRDLLIIDDLGVERDSKYMQEVVYNIIDTRYRAKLPMIITTNLTDKELAHAKEIGNTRIYDRIMERCLAVKVDGQSRRRQSVKTTWDDMRQKLGMEV